MFGLLLGSSLELTAQTSNVPADSISILSLIEEVEENTSYKIFTNMTKPFMVKKQDGAATLEQLQEALKGTFWRVNVYGQKVFVMQDFFLQKELPVGWYGNKTEQQDIKLTEVLVSENKIYEIGDKFRPSKAKRIKLTGQVIDFKTNTPAEGIHIIRREPWVAVTTDMDGRFEIELESG